MTRAFTFPGQGSQAVGMGAELAAAMPAARYVFEEIDEALKQPLGRLMFDGPMEDLTLTENAQPALMAVSLAAVRAIESEGDVALADVCSHVAGHSLGEYSALCAAGALSIEDTARLLKVRGRAMQQAVPVGEGAMAALLGLDLESAQAAALEAGQGEVCAAANDNADGQVVISGAVAAVQRAIELAKEKGAKKAIMLPVSAPFHCALMQPAADVMQEALANVTIAPPRVPVVANVTAAPTSDPETIRQLFVEQVTAMVRWRESVLALRDLGVETLVEAGAGKVLSGMVRRIDRGLTAVSVQTPHDVEAFLNAL